MQRYLYDCLHDYLVEMFLRTPQSREPAVTPLETLLRERIARSGPIPFRDSWRRRCTTRSTATIGKARDPFGKAGDFYTAEQLQPVFGILIAARIREMFREMGSPAGFHRGRTGRGPRRNGGGVRRVALHSCRDGRRSAARHSRGVIFSNEFFDALPVEAATVIDGTPRSCWSAWKAAASRG